MSEQVRWVSSEAVIVDYGFDPFPHISEHNGTVVIRNKLILMPTGCGCCLERVWHKDDVVRVAKTYNEARGVNKKLSLLRRILSNYTKGLIK